MTTGRPVASTTTTRATTSRRFTPRQHYPAAKDCMQRATRRAGGPRARVAIDVSAGEVGAGAPCLHSRSGRGGALRPCFARPPPTCRLAGAQAATRAPPCQLGREQGRARCRAACRAAGRPSGSARPSGTRRSGRRDERVSEPNVDGILFEAGQLRAVQDFSNQISRVRLNPDLESGVVEHVITSELFQIPSTAARFGNRLAVVNAKFNTGFPPTANQGGAARRAVARYGPRPTKLTTGHSSHDTQDSAQVRRCGFSPPEVPPPRVCCCPGRNRQRRSESSARHPFRFRCCFSFRPARG